MSPDPIYYELSGGARLRAFLTTPAEPRPLTVVIATGRTEFCEKYGEVVDHLAGLGYRTLVFDWRGQGRSTRLLANAQKGHIDRYGSYLADLDAALNHAASFGAPVAILGHSMGGHIALRALARWPGRVRGAALSAPMIGIAGVEAFAPVVALMAGIGCAGSYVWGRGDYGPGDTRFEGNPLTHDPVRFQRMVAAVEADPALAIGGPTWGWLHASLRSIAILRQEAARIADPVLIVSAGADAIVDNPAQATMAGQLARGRLVRVEGAAHELMQEADLYRMAFWREVEPFLEELAA